ncbi:MAG: cytochrome P450 [Dehalococcoidia bacterium]|nr:cytochrome P450 [Dehalococcoidia bacterium]
MTITKDAVKTQVLSLPEELILMLLNEESGYFYQVPGWDLNCAVVGAVLAELSIESRIDTDRDSLFVLDDTETGNSTLDPILKEIASEPAQHNAQYWIERLSHYAESIIDQTLDRLVRLNILEYHDGDFWTVAPNVEQTVLFDDAEEGTRIQFVKTRIRNEIYNNEIPDPRDVIIICLINTCDVFRFMFNLDEQAEERIEFICNMDLIGRSIAAAVSNNLAGPVLRHSRLSKKIPTVSLTKMLFNRHIRTGNVPALFADLAKEYGPVFQIRPPFAAPMIMLAGPETNRWVHRRGRLHLRSRDYFADFEKVYGASGVLPSMDGADHFRLRKSLSPAYSRGRLMGQLDELYHQTRKYMADWEVGEFYPATTMCRRMINAQLSALFVSVDSQDIFDDLTTYKERALMTHIMKILPKFMLKTPGMRRRANTVDELLERIQSVHTPAQRADSPRDLADDLLSLHASDPQFVPESNLRFALSAALIASVYLGDAFSFAMYAMVSQPEIYARIQSEADALFDNGDPDAMDFNPASIDVTHRFLMECLRMYPIVPMSLRNVMNSCVVEGYELPLGSRLYIAQTASHYMDDVFPDPFKFDIDRYLPPRNEHHSPGFAPYGLGTHTCLGSRWMELQLAVNVLMVAHYFNIKVFPPNYNLKFSPLPSMKPSKNLKFDIVERRRELNV